MGSLCGKNRNILELWLNFIKSLKHYYQFYWLIKQNDCTTTVSIKVIPLNFLHQQHAHEHVHVQNTAGFLKDWSSPKTGMVTYAFYFSCWKKMQFSMTNPDLKNFLLSSFSLFTDFVLRWCYWYLNGKAQIQKKKNTNLSLIHFSSPFERLNFDHDVLLTK